MPKHILFDFFGTLVQHGEASDSQAARTIRLLGDWGLRVPLLVVRAQLSAAYEGLEVRARETLKEYHTFEAMEALLRSLNATPSAERVRTMAEAWMADWSGTIAMEDGVKELLESLQVPKSIVSNTSTPWLVPDCLEHFKVRRLFAHVITSIDHGQRKPHPDVYGEALRHAGDAVFVGDNPECDYFGPRRVGMRAVLVSRTARDGVPEADRIASVLDLQSVLG
jgi:putative hydrolase of the HAD superfamily